MKLKSVYESSENDEYETMFKNLKNKLQEKGLLTEQKNLKHMSSYCKEGTYFRNCGYAQVRHKGELIDELADLSELEISMLVDSGYSHFGGISSKSGNKFDVIIYVD